MMDVKMRRKRESMYDPYMDIIEELLMEGKTHQQIADKLESIGLYGANKCSLYYYCKARDLRSRVTMGTHNSDIPNCDGCVRCVEVTNTKGNEERICLDLLQIVSRSVKTSPSNCPKRSRNDRNRIYQRESDKDKMPGRFQT